MKFGGDALAGRDSVEPRSQLILPFEFDASWDLELGIWDFERN